MSRRLKAIRISPHFFDAVIKKGHIHIEKSPLPEDAQYQSAHYIPEEDMFLIIYYSSDFREVIDGELIPCFDSDEFGWERLE